MRSTIRIETRGRGLHEITPLVREEVRRAGIAEGLCHVFLRHTSASLVLQENADPTARHDLEAFFDRLVPDGDPCYRHDAEGPDDMSAHIRTALTRTSETLFVSEGDLVLGTWQGLYVFEHRKAPHRRVVELLIVRA